MSTASGDRKPDEDLTAQARIRNAAIAEFASVGFAQAKVRDIARVAGVSPALIIHHFGSKVGLRETCDAYVLQALVQRARDESRPSTVRQSFRDAMANHPDFTSQVQYMVRSINDDSPAADGFVQGLLAESESLLRTGIADGSMRPMDDVPGMAVLTMLISLSILTIPPAIARALGHEATNLELIQRLAMPSIELYTHGIYTDDSMLRSIRSVLDESPPGTPSPPPQARTTLTAEGNGDD